MRLNSPVVKLAHPRPVRLYNEDDLKLRKLHQELKKEYGTEVVELLRMAVHLGLPLLEKQIQTD